MTKILQNARRASLRAGVCLCVFGIFCFFPAAGWAKRTHEIFFQGTDYELHVFRIYGQEPGKTLLLIGGIQGDEPGGFLSADLYADMDLARGNLVVVPRANFYSIVLNRREVNGDMNRQFGDNPVENYEAKIVSILKELTAQSDCLLNLHDGSGFYAPTWEGPMRNPKRFGQSIIADCDTYTVPVTGKTLHLGDMARAVAEKVNVHIADPSIRFHFNNHRTKDPDTLHAEQRKSATYYALFECGVPAFGIETSKSLPLETKIRHHNLAINAFMELLDIAPETPGIYLDPPVMRYVVMAVNDNVPVAVTNGHTLRVRQGDMVTISSVEANYERGVNADILKHGTLNDVGKPIRINSPTQVVVRKDQHPCGMINIVLDAVDAPAPSVVSALPGVLFFETRINGNEQLFMNNGTAKLVKGDRLQLVDVMTNLADSSKILVNFKGYVGDKTDNDGEDRGYVIHTDRDLWARYSLDGTGKKYQVVVTHNETVLGRLLLELEEPRLDYVIVQVNSADKRCLYPGDSLALAATDTINVLDIKTNIPTNAGVQAYLKGTTTRLALFSETKTVPRKVGLHDMADRGSRYKIEVEREQAALGFIFLDFEKGVQHGG
jgi:hypothetical protein